MVLARDMNESGSLFCHHVASPADGGSRRTVRAEAVASVPASAAADAATGTGVVEPELAYIG